MLDYIMLDYIVLNRSLAGVKPGLETANTVCFSELEVTQVLKRVVTVVRYPRVEMLSDCK